MDANLMVILTATLAVTSGISLVVFLNLLFIRTLWNDRIQQTVIEMQYRNNQLSIIMQALILTTKIFTKMKMKINII